MSDRAPRGGVDPRPTPERQAIARLLRARGIGRHALFLTQREGTRLSGGLEAVSGYVLDRGGRVFGFWLDCDADGLALVPFWPVADPDEAFGRDPEYRAARHALGLA